MDGRECGVAIWRAVRRGPRRIGELGLGGGLHGTVAYGLHPPSAPWPVESLYMRVVSCCVVSVSGFENAAMAFSVFCSLASEALQNVFYKLQTSDQAWKMRGLFW